MRANRLTLNERDFQSQVREVAKVLGWTVFTTWNSYNSPAGEPDLRMVRPPRVIFAELKSERGRTTVAQEEALELLRECTGVEAYLWRPSDWDEIVACLQHPDEPDMYWRGS